MMTAIHGSKHCYFGEQRAAADTWMIFVTSVKGSCEVESLCSLIIQWVRTMNKSPLYTPRQRMSRVYPAYVLRDACTDFALSYSELKTHLALLRCLGPPSSAPPDIMRDILLVGPSYRDDIAKLKIELLTVLAGGQQEPVPRPARGNEPRRQLQEERGMMAGIFSLNDQRERRGTGTRGKRKEEDAPAPSVRDTAVSSIFLSSGKLIFNTPTANPSSLIAAIGSTVSILSSSLSLNSLRFVNASLDVSSLNQFTLDCPSVSLERNFTILAPTTPIQITRIFDSMLINGNITETHAVHHVYTSNTNATITTKNYPLSSSGPLYLWNSQSTVHFSSLEYLLQAPQVILAETVSFDSSSSLTLNETFTGTLPTIDASSSSFNLSTVFFDIQYVYPYYQMNSTLIIAKTLNADLSKVTVQPSNDGDTSCQGPTVVTIVNGHNLVLYLAAYAVKPVQDFKVVRGNTPDLVNVTFTPVVDSCVQNVRYTVSDDSHNSNYLGEFVGSTPVFVQLTDTTTGTHVYSLTFDYDMKTGYKTNGGVSNTYTYNRPIIRSDASVKSACFALVVAAVALLF
ncbi:hypothetical protein PROFUN_08959 [Planoprotostelium fungivorum]|uniref:Uncharacterized protein n=1 Tax=Planoprotostelium fungivorum TaxID=1890364 RepID=A0A2P6NIS4_9EUKA|nr:hypothetical protein PROFUN_08959 [Planoprotostelium fungivorum]